MKRLALLLAPALLCAACVTNPYTGRDQFILLSTDEEFALGREAYQQALAEANLSTNPAETTPVTRIGGRIARAADGWAGERNQPMPFDWEFNTIADTETANAWCLPGGKIAVYTGIYPVAENEAGLAVVMGHEVAHALLRHGAERISQGLAAQLGAVLVAAALHDKDKDTVALAMAAYGVGVGLAVLQPYSREQESEADHVGLLLAARAGYDPREGIALWRRMAAEHPNSVPEFLSTHPSHETRIANMESWMNEAIAAYDASDKAESPHLPRPGSPGAPAPGVAVRADAGSAVRAADGLHVAFRLDQDAFLQSLACSGPGGYEAAIQPGAAVAGGKFIEAVFPGDPREMPDGTYTVTLRGVHSGRPFECAVRYALR